MVFFPGLAIAQTVIDFGFYEREVLTGQEIIFSLKSRDNFFPEQAIFFWDFGDGEQKQGREVSYIYNNEGEYLAGAYVLAEDFLWSGQILLEVRDMAGSAVGSLAGFSKNIVFNEILPNPEGSDEEFEWIELKNLGSQALDLSGWSVEDASGKKAILTLEKYSDLSVAPKGYFLINRTISKITLNNSGDSLKLIDASGNTVATASYQDDVVEGFSWARDDSGSWSWTETITPGWANEFSENLNQAEKKSEEYEIEISTSTLDENVRVLGFSSLAEESEFFNLRINELLPNPSGDERKYEFIEIKNFSEQKINLAGFYLTDNKNYYYFPENVFVSSGGFVVIGREDSKIALNNIGDELFLFSPADELIDRVLFAAASSDQSWSRDGENWLWTENITPGEDNYFSEEEKTNSLDQDGYFFISSLSEVKDLEPDTKIKLQGIVSVLPGFLGKQFFYIQDAGAGIQVYMYAADWPEIQIGDIVEVAGVVSQARGEVRVKAKTSDDIYIIGQGIDPEAFDISGADDYLIGGLVSFSGQIVEKNSRNWTVAGLEQDVEIIFKFAPTEVDYFKEGDQVSVVGILRKADSDFRIYPRSAADFVLIESFDKNNFLLENEKSDFDNFSSKKGISWFMPYTILSGIIIILVVKIYLLKK